MLKYEYPEIVFSFEKLEKVFNFEIKYLENTKDIWVRDFMPIETFEKRFVQYQYKPNYLEGEKYRYLITNVDEVLPYSLKEKVGMTDIVLDGGNFVRLGKKVIMTDKIYEENPMYEKCELNNKIKLDFEIDELIIIPRQPYDIYGHSDSMVRWVNNHTVIINDFSLESTMFNKKLLTSLERHNLKIEQLEYEKDFFNINRNWGAYLNFIELDNLIVIPNYDGVCSKKVYQKIKKLFDDVEVVFINSDNLIKMGGALHCISWVIET